jgi:hypothetical protein
MASQVTLTSYDPITKQYTAKLVVTEADATVMEYTCTGTWQDTPEQIQMIAGSLYGQHKVAVTAKSTIETEKTTIAGKIAVEVTKLEAAKVAETKEVPLG